MNYLWGLLALQALLIGSAFGQEFEFIDISDEPTIFETDILPQMENGTLLPRYIASVGNGHISTTAYTDTVFMNGLYNGETGESHRARIPSRNNYRVAPTTDNVEIQDHRYGLDVTKGYFYERYYVEGYQVEQKIFAHRYFNRVLVTQLVFSATDAAVSPLDISVVSDPGPPSDDITFEPASDFNSSYELPAKMQCGQTNLLEDPVYQKENISICVVYTEGPPIVTLTPGISRTIYLLAAYDFDANNTGSEYEAAATYEGTDGSDLLILHVAAWETVWNDGLIEVEGNVELSKVIYGSLYYILSALPVTTTTSSPQRQFYGLSPGSLAFGSYLMDYQGHSFWDTETWMFPTMLYLFPQAAKQALNYRLSVIQAARDRANETGYLGARFPWEGAVTGREVTPDCCVDTRDLQIHITADISYAVRQYIATTRDMDWLTNTQEGYLTNGCGMIREMAEFYTSRAHFNTTTRLHDIRGIMPPDEDNRPVDNNPYTNIGAGLAIFFAKYAECLCGESMTPIPQEWVDLASSLTLLYDEENDYHPEFEGYELGTPIKQADVVLIGFPQLYDMPASTRRNDLLIYENVTRPDGPAMTWAMHTIGFLDLDDVNKAAEIFNKSYQSYVRQPYKVWTEAQPPTLGAINFITGMGGFLQSIVSGYGGYRLYPEQIVFHKPRLPPNTTGLKIKGLNYLGNTFDISVAETTFTMTLIRGNINFPLEVKHAEFTYPFQEVGASIGFSNTRPLVGVTMYSTRTTSCPLPLDKIGTPRP